MIDVSRLDPAPLGFGRCALCPYLQTGTPAICFGCADRLFESPATRRCAICEQGLGHSDECANRLCGSADRQFDAVKAVAMRTGPLKDAISNYKYGGKKGWAWIFGRVIVGYLDENAAAFSRSDLITAMPSYTGPDADRNWDHIALILQRAAVESAGRWPFDLGDPLAIQKTAETPSLVSCGAGERESVARDKLRPALSVPAHDRVRGGRIVVIDDIFTRGTTLNEVARALKGAGAVEVVGLVLARQPWAY